eukprot:13762-Heterococcus_DN1.PRE.4
MMMKLHSSAVTQKAARCNCCCLSEGSCTSVVVHEWYEMMAAGTSELRKMGMRVLSKTSSASSSQSPSQLDSHRPDVPAFGPETVTEAYRQKYADIVAECMETLTVSQIMTLGQLSTHCNVEHVPDVEVE